MAHDPEAPPEGPQLWRVRLTLPACLRLVESPPHGVGVFAAEPLPRGLRLGPYQGRRRRVDAPTGTGWYGWRMHNGRLVDTGDEAHSNWMRFVNCTPHAARPNLAGFQYRGALYYRTVAPVAVGDELLVYYGDDYARNLGVDADGYYEYVPPKEKPDTEPDATGAVGDGSDYYVPPKEEPKPELCGNDGNASGGYAHHIEVDSYCTYDLPKEESEAAVDVRSAGDDHVRNIGADSCSDPLEEEPELRVGDRDAVDIDGCYDCDPLKEEPEPDPPAVADGRIDVRYDCSHCGIGLGSQKFKDKHERRCKAQMQRRAVESQVTKLYHCGYCRCPFLNEEYKEQHQRRYCRKRPVKKRKIFNGTYFGCAKCKYATKWKDTLARHLLTHDKNNAEWFTCTQCSYKTVQKYLLAKHMKTHDNKFNCFCTICGRSFRTKSGLDDHLLRLHFDESDAVSKLITSKFYTCDICNQFRTTIKSCFNEHVTLTHHSGAYQKYECPLCPYSTFRKYTLNKHSKMHLNQKDYYRCTICMKQFTRKHALDSHVLRYHADNVDLVKTITTKIHRCKLCSYKTVSLCNLKNHIQSKHI